MVTKQEQLEWLAESFSVWPGFRQTAIKMSTAILGTTSSEVSVCHSIGVFEWQRERDKMQKEQDNSWHELGELPPVGCECNYVTGISCVQVKIQGVGHVDGYHVAFFAMKDSWCTATAEFFRPLRTEREKAIDSLIDIICAGGYLTDRDGAAKTIAERIYDAGYRITKP